MNLINKIWTKFIALPRMQSVKQWSTLESDAVAVGIDSRIFPAIWTSRLPKFAYLSIPSIFFLLVFHLHTVILEKKKTLISHNMCCCSKLKLGKYHRNLCQFQSFFINGSILCFISNIITRLAKKETDQMGWACC